MSDIHELILSEDNMKQLNILMEDLYNSHKGYYESADDIEDEALKEKFKATAAQRNIMRQTIKELFIRSDVKPASGGTTLGKVHRIFVNLKALVMEKNEKSILSEVEREEKHLINTYRNTMDEIQVPLILNLLHKQFEEVQADLIKWQEIHNSLLN